MATLSKSSCELARERLLQQQVAPHSKHQPRGSTTYFPRSAIIKFLSEFPVRDILTCPCGRCDHYAGSQGSASDRRAMLYEEDLLGQYATTYGLLIYLGYPSLIHFFMRQSISLENRLFSYEDLNFLDQCTTLTDLEKQTIRQEILEYQYRFRVHRLLLTRTISTLSEKQVLPIKEEGTPVGRSYLGEVYAFTISKEYMDEDLKSRQIKRFARRIFDRSWTETKYFLGERNQVRTAKEWVKCLHATDYHHPNLMEILAAFEHGECFSAILELAQTTLYKLLLGAGGISFSSQELWSQIQGLADGLAYLHKKDIAKVNWRHGKIYHLDLNLSKVLIVNGVMKIADFGLFNYKSDPDLPELGMGPLETIGRGAHVPPPGRVDGTFDVFSLGTIISEIACFDIGKKLRVVRYRRRRESDIRQGQRPGSEHFYYRTTYQLKRSVIQEHLDLLRIIEGSTRNGNPSWQQVFYGQELFDLITDMLHRSADGRPEAETVATKLGVMIKRASEEVQRCLPKNLYIGEETKKGSAIVKTSPANLAHEGLSHLTLIHNTPTFSFTRKEQCRF
ncbi:kinase-like domain-containing protein [Pyrenochaeta sp. MPI-SDFR-AT-0127]|nr:kinase-like domain-containing protein [Pyrenochaeta sp. MPI-SDFR-AT-0127]